MIMMRMGNQVKSKTYIGMKIIGNDDLKTISERPGTI